MKMIFEIPIGTPVEYMHSWHLALWILGTLILFIACVIFLKRSNQQGLIESQKQLFRSYASFAIFMGICRAFFMMAYNDLFDAYGILLHIGFFFGQLSLIPAIWVFEKYLVTKTRKVFTILAIALTIISVFGIFFTNQTIVDLLSQRFGAPVLAVVYFYLYIYIAKTTTGIMRRNSILMIIGFSVLCLGIIMDSIEIVKNPLIPLWISPVLFNIGGLIILITQRSK